MLVRVTENCDMGCTHCMIDANPEGQHMSLSTYNEVIMHLKGLEMPIIMLSGGEPTKHPYVIEMIEIAKKANLVPCLLSNGTFLENNNLKEKILNLDIHIQITNDSRYYPRKIPIIENSKVAYEHHIRGISPFHRAIKNSIPSTTNAPLCFNFRSLCHHIKNYQAAMMGLRMYGKMCTPSINIDGSIAAGESNACATIGYVTDTSEHLIHRACSIKCNKCSLVYNLTNPQKKAIGELR